MIMIPLKGNGGAAGNNPHQHPQQAINSNNTSINNAGSITQHSLVNNLVGMEASSTTGVLSHQQQQQLMNLSASSAVNQSKKNSSKQRQQQNPTMLGAQGPQGAASLSGSTHNIQQQRQQEINNQAVLKAAAAAAASLAHNQTTKIPQNFLMGGNSSSQNSNYNSIQPPPSAAQVMKGLMMVPIASSVVDKSQKKRIGIKKVDESADAKTIEQQMLMQSPNSSTLNLENMKKTQSIHYVARGAGNGSGANSPQQQMKSRTSIGKYQNPASVLGMQIYNNYNNASLLSNTQTQQPRNSFLSKSQIGGAGLIQQGLPMPQSASGSAGGPNGGGLSNGSRSRSKTATNRKKRNLYTSIGNYYQSQQQTNASSQAQPGVSAANSASRASKRLNPQQNFLENLEQTNLLLGGNIAAAHQMLLQEDLLTKKRNKSSTKSYNNKGDLIDPHNTSSEVCYSSHLGKKNPLTNNFFEVSQFSGSNHTSLVAQKPGNTFGDSFQGGSFLPQQKPHASTVGLFSANKQRPTSSNKSALMIAASNLSSAKQQNPSQQPKKKQTTSLRKSVNTTLMNQSANYGHLQQNAYDFLSNANLFMNTGKSAARRAKGSSGIDSRCSQTKDHHGGGAPALSGLAKSQISSNTAFGVPIPNLNNTSHTTICSNRKQGNHVEIVSGKKHSLQHQQVVHQNYMSLPQHTQDVLTAGEISSDRQTLKMNDFLKQIEAYSNDKLDKFMPQMNQAQHLNNIIGSASSMGHNTGNGSVASNYGILNQQAKIAEQVKNMIDQEMQAASAQNHQLRSSAKRRYQRDEQREDQDDDEGDADEDSLPADTPVTSGGGLNTPDYEHLLNVISDGFNKLIATFYNNNASAIIGASLARVKESYEEIINSIVENLSQQIEGLSLENEQLSQENLMYKERAKQIEKMADTQEKSSQQITSYARQNEVLERELCKLTEENKNLKKEQRDRDSQLVESRKLIEKLSSSQKQLASQSSNLNHLNSQVSSKTAARQGDSMVFNQQSNKVTGQRQNVPLLDLGKLAQLPPQGQVQQPPAIQQLMSNDSLDTLNKGLINANLPDIDQPPSEISSAFMNTVPHHEGSRMLEEIYQHQHQAPFMANHSEISYQNSDEEDEKADAEAAYLSGGGHQRVGGVMSDSSSIAQDKSPLQKPFIPPLNLNGLNNRQQAAQQQQQVILPQQPQQQQQQIPQKQPKFKLDIGQVVQQQQQFVNTQPMMKLQDQDSSEVVHYKHQQPPARPQGALGLNLANLKKDRGIVDFHEEFMARADEYSESWRDAMRKEKRF